MAEILTIGTSFADPAAYEKGRLELKGADEASISIHNTGSVALNGFKVVFFVNATAKASDGPSTAAEWTSPAAGGVILHSSPVDPTTLAAGSSMYFVLDRIKTMHSFQILATVASGTGELTVNFGRG